MFYDVPLLLLFLATYFVIVNKVIGEAYSIVGEVPIVVGKVCIIGKFKKHNTMVAPILFHR